MCFESSKLRILKVLKNKHLEVQSKYFAKNAKEKLFENDS